MQYFLHQLDEHMIKELRANEIETKRESVARRSLEYHRIDNKIRRLRRKLKQTTGNARRALIKDTRRARTAITVTPYFAKEHRHPSKIGYARYADDLSSWYRARRTKPRPERTKSERNSRKWD